MASTPASELVFSSSNVNTEVFLPQVDRHETANIPRRMISSNGADMAGILGGLAELNLGARPVLVNHTNIINIGTIPESNEVIEISDIVPDTRPALPSRYAVQKARQLELLAKQASSATTDVELSRLVLEFIQVMLSNTGRTLTRPAFQFLDMLYKQLNDPSALAQPGKWVSSITRGDLELIIVGSLSGCPIPDPSASQYQRRKSSHRDSNWVL